MKCFIDAYFSNTEAAFRQELTRLLELYGKDFKIDTPKRVALFFANVKAEIGIKRGGVVRMRENMNYTPGRLFVVSKFFRTHRKLAFRFGRTKEHKANIKEIANYFYANRLGNRGVNSGDGYRYRGAGILQSTGRYTILRDALEVERVCGFKMIDPNTRDVYAGLLDSYTGGILLGFAYWHRSKMWQCESIDCSVDIINRHTDSRAKRRKFYYRALRLLKKCKGV